MYSAPCCFLRDLSAPHDDGNFLPSSSLYRVFSSSVLQFFASLVPTCPSRPPSTSPGKTTAFILVPIYSGTVGGNVRKLCWALNINAHPHVVSPPTQVAVLGEVRSLLYTVFMLHYVALDGSKDLWGPSASNDVAELSAFKCLLFPYYSSSYCKPGPQISSNKHLD